MVQLTELEHDVLTEFLNLGIGRAANNLSQMVDQEVLLAVPQLEIMTVNSVIAHLEGSYPSEVASVHQAISGPIQGDVVTLFASSDSLQLVRALLKEEVPVEALSELECEALMEVGNVVQNACVAAIANQLELEIQTSIPDSQNGSIRDVLLDGHALNAESSVLFFRINFQLAESDICGHLILTLGLESGETFRTHLSQFVAHLERNEQPNA